MVWNSTFFFILIEAEKDKLFKKFGKIEQYGKGMNGISEGFGLGLYISKKVIEHHGGEIWVNRREEIKDLNFISPDREQERNKTDFFY